MTKLKGVLSQGPDILATMVSGARGSSAYEVWLKQGNIGTEEEFLESLKASAVDYSTLDNKPSIDDVVLEGNKSFEELGITSINKNDIENLF